MCICPYIWGMNKKTIISLSLITLVAIIATLIFWLSRTGRIKTPAVHAIPADAEFILEIYNPFETGRKNLQYPFWKLSDSNSFVQSFIHDFNILDSLIRNNEKTQEFFRETTLYVSAHPFQNQTQWLFLCNINRTIKSHFIDQFVVKANKAYTMNKIETNWGIIKRIQISNEGQFLHYALKNNIWIASMHIEQVKSALQTIHEKNGYTAQPDYEKLMKLQPENQGITALTNIKGLIKVVSLFWELGNVSPDFISFTIPGHYTFQFDSLKIVAEGILPKDSSQTIMEYLLPVASVNWKIENQFIPANTHTVLSYHISPDMYKLKQTQWIHLLRGCTHTLLFRDSTKEHTWLILPVENNATSILEQICDSILTDTVMANISIPWGNINNNPKEDLQWLPFHTLLPLFQVAGMIENRLILAQSKESFFRYYDEIKLDSMAENNIFAVPGGESTTGRFSWQIWIKPKIFLSYDNELKKHSINSSSLEYIILRCVNKNNFVRAYLELRY